MTEQLLDRLRALGVQREELSSRQKRLGEEVREAAREAYANDVPVLKIAQALGMSPQATYSMLPPPEHKRNVNWPNDNGTGS